MDKKIKFKGLWTPEYLAKCLLFPTSKTIQQAEVMLKSWAVDIVEENTPSPNTELERELDLAKKDIVVYMNQRDYRSKIIKEQDVIIEALEKEVNAYRLFLKEWETKHNQLETELESLKAKN